MDAVDTGTSVPSEGIGAGEGQDFNGEDVDFFTGEKRHAKYQKPKVYEPKADTKPKPKPALYEDVTKEQQGDPEEQDGQKKFKLKIEGEEREFTLDELLKTKSLEQSSYKKMEQAAEISKKAEGILKEYESLKSNVAKYENSHNILNNLTNQLSENPDVIFSILEKLGHDPDKLAEERLYKKWQYANLTEEQRDYLRLKEFEKQTFAKHEQEKAEAAKQAYESEKHTYASELNSQFGELFKELGGRPDPLTLKLTIEQLQLAHKRKTPITVKEAHAKVVQALQPQYREKWLKEIAEKDFEGLPEDFVKRVREHDLAKFRAEKVPGRKANAPTEQQEQTPRKPKPVVIDDSNFDDLLFGRRR